MSLRLKLGIFLLFTSLTYAQEVNYQDKTYTVKGDIILQSGVDVTNRLTLEKRETIQRRASRPKNNTLKKSKKKSNRSSNLDLASIEQRETIQKRASKPRKNTSKKNKQKSNRSSNLNEASKELKDVYNTYGELKRSGNISRSEETKLIEKIEKLKAKIAKAKDKLK